MNVEEMNMQEMGTQDMSTQAMKTQEMNAQEMDTQVMSMQAMNRKNEYARNEGSMQRRVWCSRLTGPGVLLLGDAAHAVTPVGGQGANAALEDTLFLDGILDATGKSAHIQHVCVRTQHVILHTHLVGTSPSLDNDVAHVAMHVAIQISASCQ